MQFLWTSVLRHVRVRNSLLPRSFLEVGKSLHHPSSHMYASTSTNSDHLMAQVIGLVKKYDRVDASKRQLYFGSFQQVSETADFQKDLCLDSLDMVELVMALEQEFSTEIPEDKADKLTCCADVVNYLLTKSNYPTAKSS
ncbi:acyl carrier protein 3, mitochondrial-like isoform X1 [Aristolochia californica]|uniref:acyl carrier protein 3, mitochondrial-like isoform X1 n=1 Tax=Aristolochia californica TaxID=171875 RepID=UPI0035DE0AD3